MDESLPSAAAPAAPAASASDAIGWRREWFDALSDALGRHGVEEELCRVGGAVLRLVFQLDPGTRRPRALFGDVGRAKAAQAEVAGELGLSADWVERAARSFLEDPTRLYHGEALRVFVPPPDYVLALKCAALRFAPDSDTAGDVRYLLTYSGVRTPAQGIAIVDRYLTERQRPPDLEDTLARLLD